MPFAATWMDVDSVILSEVSRTEKNYRVISFICGLQKEMIQMNLKNKDSYRLKKQTYGCRRSGESQGKGIIREFEMDMYTLLYLKWITNKDPPYSIWNSAQCYVAAWMGGEFGREWIHVYLYG